MNLVELKDRIPRACPELYARAPAPMDPERPITASLMNRKRQTTPMQDNLRVLVDRFESVAAFCRATDINRQQFNKYLAGVHEPSARTIARLCEQFRVAASDFQLSRAQFEARLAADGPTQSSALGSSALKQFEGFALASVHELKPFLGTYFRYHHSSIYPGRIVRAVTVIYRNKDLVEHLTIERFPMPEDEGKGHYSFLYTGVCYMLGNRVFMVDYERRQRNEMTMAILMPQHRTPMRFLYGLLTGVASSTFRQPFSSRVIFERRSDDTSIRKGKLRLATVLEPGHPDISSAVARYFESSEGRLIFGNE